MRLSVVVAVACLTLVSLSVADESQASIRKHTDIPAQELGTALRSLAKDRGFQLVYLSDTVETLHTGGAVGEFTTDQALKKLLNGSGLDYEYVDENTVSIFPHATSRATSGVSGGQGDEDSSRPGDPEFFWNRLRLAQTTPGPAQGTNSVNSSSSPSNQSPATSTQGISEPVRLEEIVVTAQKRVERLMEVPVPVTAINAATLSENNQTRLMDYYTQVPGLIVSPADYSSQLVAIRGITTGSNSGAGTPTTGIMVDEIPFGNSTGNTPGFTVPDFDPGDLARVEVLRGPQGTLYGASSMGGLIKYVTVDPSTAGFSGRLEAGTNSVRNGDELGYTVRGAVNVPVSTSFAIRGSAFTRLDAGYIDNPFLGKEGVNKARANGARLSGLWKPMDHFSLKLSATYQEIRGDGTSDFTSTENVTGQFNSLGDLQQGYIAGVGPYKRKAEAYGAVAVYKVGEAELTSVTGYNVSDVQDSIDYTQYIGGLSLETFGVGGAPIFEDVTNSRFSQELRLAFPLGARFDGLLGAYYDAEKAGPQRQRLLASDPLTGAIAGVWLDVSFPSTYRERAAFADLTWHLTDRFDVQIGGRESRMRIRLKDSISIGTPPIAGPDPAIREGLAVDNDSFTYLITPSYKLSEGRMLYARFASGYRPGGPNIVPSVPPIVRPDKTENYEIGFKGEFLDGRVSIDTSIYYIDWKDIQLNLIDPATLFGFTGNAGKARSLGVEFSMTWRPGNGLNIATWVAYNDAKLTNWPAEAQAACESFTGVCASAGARLPLSPHVSGNLSVDQRFRATDRVNVFVGANLSYVGGRKGVFPFNDPSVPRQEFPAYARTDLRAGLDFAAWRANVYVNNVFDRRALVSGGAWTDLPYSFYYIQPRTIGVSLAREF